MRLTLAESGWAGSFISTGTWKRILPEMFHDGCRLAVLLVLVLVLVLVLGSLLQ
jgi:hypothetical protein